MKKHKKTNQKLNLNKSTLQKLIRGGADSGCHGTCVNSCYNMSCACPPPVQQP